MGGKQQRYEARSRDKTLWRGRQRQEQAKSNRGKERQIHTEIGETYRDRLRENERERRYGGQGGGGKRESERRKRERIVTSNPNNFPVLDSNIPSHTKRTEVEPLPCAETRLNWFYSLYPNDSTIR